MNKPAKVDVILNNEQAKREMEVLKSKIKDFIELRDEALKAKNMPLFDRLNKVTKDATAELRKMEKQTYDVERVLANISGASINELEKAFKQANLSMKKMERDGVSGYEEQRKKVKQLKDEIDKVNESNRAGESGWKRMSETFNKYVGIVATGLAAVTGVGLIAKKAIDSFNAFEEKLKEVSSLTGLTGDDLQKLGEESKKMSVSTVEGGIRITQSAVEIQEAFKVMGGAKPELLANAAALKTVTQDAIILSKASKDELEPTVKNLALTMNQFSASADESRRYINVLAAGALAGSAEVEDISTAIVKFGAAAAAANISVEQSVGAIETLAEKGIKGEIAGTALRNVILKLQQGADDTNPKIVGLSTALENLKNKNIGVTEMTKLFGVENYTAGQILVESAGRVDFFTKAVTGTNVALEQARINSDTNNARLAQAKNEMNLVAIAVGEKLSPAYTTSTNALTGLLKGVVALVDTFHIWGPILVSATAGIAAYTIATNLSTIATKIKTLATWEGSLAQRALNAAMAANPLGLFIAGLAAAATALMFFVGRETEAMKLEKEHQKALDDSAEAIRKEKVDIQLLTEAAKDEKRSKQDRLKSLNDLKAAAGGYLDGLTLENLATKEGARLLALANQELERKIWLEGNQKELKKNIEDYEAIQDQRFGKDRKGGGTYANYITAQKEANNASNTRGTGGMYSSGFSDKESKEHAAMEAGRVDAELLQKENALMDQRKKLYDRKDQLLSQIPKGNPTNEDKDKNNGSGSSSGGGESTKAKREKELKDKYDAELKILKNSGDDEKNLLEKQHNEGSINDATYKALQLKADLDFLTNKKLLQEKFGQSSEETQNEYDKRILDAAAESNALLLKAKEELANAGFDNIQDAIDKQIAIEEEAWRKELADLQERILTKEQLNRDLTDKEIELNNTVNKIIEEKTKTHNDKIADLNTAKSFEQLDYNELAAKTDEERWTAQAAKAKAAYNSDLKLAGDNQLKKLQAEKKYAKASLDIETEKIEKLKSIRMRDVANAEMAVNILATVVGKNTILGKALFVAQQGLAIARIWIENAAADGQIYAKNLVMFATAGPAAPGLAAAWSAPAWAANKTSALLNTGLIAAQTIAGFMGKKSGGFTDNDSSDDKVVDYVHSNEFVANAGAVRNPTVKPILDIIDYAQRSGSIRTINLPAVIAASSGLSSSGKKSGGFTSPSLMSIPSFDFPSFGNDPELKAMVAENARINAALLKRLEQPITADVSLLGPDGFIEKQAKLLQIQKNANF